MSIVFIVFGIDIPRVEVVFEIFSGTDFFFISVNRKLGAERDVRARRSVGHYACVPFETDARIGRDFLAVFINNQPAVRFSYEF